MTSPIEHYIQYYTPLVQNFVREMEFLEHPGIDHMPEPFLPAFGTHYHESALRLAIIGQDTRWWWDLRQFIAAERANPGAVLRERLAHFRTHKFTEWGDRRQTFWGFAMMFLAALHGREDWEAMKRGAMSDILDRFAWGNGNAIELYQSTVKGMGVPRDYWNKVRKAGEPLNRFRHLVETLQPHVAIIMYRGLDVASYFEGYKYEKVLSDGRLTHFHLPEIDVDVFHVPHPGSMNRIEGTNHFCEKLTELFRSRGMSTTFPEFINGQQEGAKVIEILRKTIPKAGSGIDKFEAVARVADKLFDLDIFMSVPTLCKLLNELGYRTNYGSEFSGGRGSYRLVSRTYHHMSNSEQHDRAHRVAVAFRRPNFEYAYSAG
jgi:hypothetical protein